MAALTLLEASKLMTDDRQRAVVQLYAQTYHPWTVMPIQSRPNGIFRWTLEDQLDSNVGVRAIGSDFTAGNGTVKPYTSITKAYGGKISVDDKIAKEEPEAVTFYKAQQVRALARKATIDLFEGAGSTSFRGVRNWVMTDYTSQDVTMGSTSGGIVITMSKMDTALSYADVIPGRTFIYSNYIPFQVMATLARTNGTGQQNIQWNKNEFGELIPYYAGIPWIVLRDGKGTDLLSVVETDTAITGGSACSVYIVTFGEEMLTGFQSNGPTVELAQDGTNFKTSRLDWYPGIAPVRPRSVVRLNNVKNALS
jgi:hypothetical protein